MFYMLIERFDKNTRKIIHTQEYTINIKHKYKYTIEWHIGSVITNFNRMHLNAKDIWL